MTNSGAIVLRGETDWGERGWLVAAGLLIQTTLGLLFAWSAFLTPLFSVHGWDASTLLAPYRHSLVWFTFGLLVAARQAERRSPKTLARVGGCLLVGGCLFAAFFGSAEFGLTLGIGVMGGLGAGFAYLAPLATFRHWLPRHGTTFLGLTMLCFGLGSFLFAPLLRAVLGSTPAAYSETIPQAFLMMASLFAIGVLGAGELLPATRVWLAPRVFETILREWPQQEERPGEAWLRRSVPLVRLWLEWGMFFLGAFAGVTALQNSVPSLGSIRWHEAWLATGVCVALVALANRIGHSFWAGLAARAGRVGALLILILISVGLSLLLTGGRLETTPAMAVLSILGFGFGGFLGLMPHLAAEMMDADDDLPMSFGVMFSAFGLCAFAAPFWLYAKRPETLLGNVSLLAISLGLLLGFLYLLLRPTRRRGALSQAMNHW